MTSRVPSVVLTSGVGIPGMLRARWALKRGANAAAACGPPCGADGTRWRSCTYLARRPFGAAVARLGYGLTWSRPPLGGPMPWAAWTSLVASMVRAGGGSVDVVIVGILLEGTGRHVSGFPGRGRALGALVAAACGPPSGAVGARWCSLTYLVMRPFGAAGARTGNDLSWPRRPLGGPMPRAAEASSVAWTVRAEGGHGCAGREGMSCVELE